MTIAVGVLATDGIVLAADTQLTIPQLWKGESGKFTAGHVVLHKAQVQGACAITGATTLLDSLHKLGDDIRDDFMSSLEAIS